MCSMNLIHHYAQVTSKDIKYTQVLLYSLRELYFAFHWENYTLPFMCSHLMLQHQVRMFECKHGFKARSMNLGYLAHSSTRKTYAHLMTWWRYLLVVYPSSHDSKYISFSNMIPIEVMMDIYVPCAGILYGVVGYLDCASIITQRGTFW